MAIALLTTPPETLLTPQLHFLGMSSPSEPDRSAADAAELEALIASQDDADERLDEHDDEESDEESVDDEADLAEGPDAAEEKTLDETVEEGLDDEEAEDAAPDQAQLRTL